MTKRFIIALIAAGFMLAAMLIWTGNGADWWPNSVGVYR